LRIFLIAASRFGEAAGFARGGADTGEGPVTTLANTLADTPPDPPPGTPPAIPPDTVASGSAAHGANFRWVCRAAGCA